MDMPNSLGSKNWSGAGAETAAWEEGWVRYDELAVSVVVVVDEVEVAVELLGMAELDVAAVVVDTDEDGTFVGRAAKPLLLNRKYPLS